MTQKKMILFTDSKGNPLFTVPDGGTIELSYGNGDSACALCHYAGEGQVKIDGRCLEIKQYAKLMERNGIAYAPV